MPGKVVKHRMGVPGKHNLARGTRHLIGLVCSNDIILIKSLSGTGGCACEADSKLH